MNYEAQRKQILKFIQKAYESAAQTEVSEDSTRSGANFSQNEIVQKLFDGMSTGTAKIIIEQEVSQAIEEKFNIDQVKNKGRYYTAKMVRPDGSTIQRLLVDKQTGIVQMTGR